ncbi:MAG: glycosyltransferase family 2 protein [Burkholderiaceae bacterium]|jgi:rhamnosyltransferase|nr:glycosyltransferase family 2 protein [Burkholderiaceae bacterium]
MNTSATSAAAATAHAAAAAAPAVCVHAVVVSHRADWLRLMRQFAALSRQVDQIVWVDSASGQDLARWLPECPPGQVHPIWLDGNHGIGYAQNRGIEWACANGATHILLMDHDSLPQGDMVRALLAALQQDPRAAAAGPRYFDARREKQRPIFFRSRGWRLQWIGCERQSGPVLVDHVIASGCLIPVPVLRQIGLMREDFFIDWVDVEWCLRARVQGYHIWGVCDAALEHHLGDKVVRIAGREVPLHPAWRHYYQARNLVLMLKSVRIDAHTKRHHAVQQFKRFVVFSICAPRRWQYFKMWTLGLWHGFRGKSGASIRP